MNLHRLRLFYEVAGTRVSLSEEGRVSQEFSGRLLRLEGEAEEALADLRGLPLGPLRIDATCIVGDYYLPEAAGARGRETPPGPDGPLATKSASCHGQFAHPHRMKILLAHPHPAFGHPLPQAGEGEGEGDFLSRSTRGAGSPTHAT